MYSQTMCRFLVIDLKSRNLDWVKRIVTELLYMFFCIRSPDSSHFVGLLKYLWYVEENILNLKFKPFLSQDLQWIMYTVHNFSYIIRYIEGIKQDKKQDMSSVHIYLSFFLNLWFHAAVSLPFLMAESQIQFSVCCL